MKKFGVGILSIIFLLAGCISNDENVEAVLEKDKQAIQKYIKDNNVVGVKEFKDESLGFVFIWKDASGSGVKATPGDTISVNYTGKLLNNVVFDTSLEDVAKENMIFDANRVYRPFTYIFDRRQVIAGFDFAVSKMDEGDKIIALIPSVYAYGLAGSPPRIPSNTPLIFELELLADEVVGDDDE